MKILDFDELVLIKKRIPDFLIEDRKQVNIQLLGIVKKKLNKFSFLMKEDISKLTSFLEEAGSRNDLKQKMDIYEKSFKLAQVIFDYKYVFLKTIKNVIKNMQDEDFILTLIYKEDFLEIQHIIRNMEREWLIFMKEYYSWKT